MSSPSASRAAIELAVAGGAGRALVAGEERADLVSGDMGGPAQQLSPAGGDDLGVQARQGPHRAGGLRQRRADVTVAQRLPQAELGQAVEDQLPFGGVRDPARPPSQRRDVRRRHGRERGDVGLADDGALAEEPGGGQPGGELLCRRIGGEAKDPAERARGEAVAAQRGAPRLSRLLRLDPRRHQPGDDPARHRRQRRPASARRPSSRSRTGFSVLAAIHWRIAARCGPVREWGTTAWYLTGSPGARTWRTRPAPSRLSRWPGSFRRVSPGPRTSSFSPGLAGSPRASR